MPPSRKSWTLATICCVSSTSETGELVLERGLKEEKKLKLDIRYEAEIKTCKVSLRILSDTHRGMPVPSVEMEEWCTV